MIKHPYLLLPLLLFLTATACGQNVNMESKAEEVPLDQKIGQMLNSEYQPA